MVKQYTATELEKSFSKVARARKGNKEFANDATYWEGGHCNWGGSHNLNKDCQTLANAFNKIGSLSDIKKELKECTSKQEYDAKKQNFIRKCEEAEAGLKTNTGASSSMFGICIIWAHEATSKTVENKVKVCREELQSIKKALQKDDYKWVQELKELESEISEITRRMEENKRKAMKPEIGPTEKATLIQLIEEDGNLLQQKYAKKKELSNRLNFDPAKKVWNMIEAMKKAIESNRHLRMPSASHKKKPNNRNDTDSNNDSDSESSSEDDDMGNSRQRPGERKKTPQNWWQENQQLIIIAGLTFLVIFYLYSQPEEPKTNSHG